MITDSACTIYFFINDKYIKRYISKCHWEEKTGNTVGKSGMVARNETVIYIPLKSLDLTPAEFLLIQEELFPGTSNYPQKPTQDIVVRDYCDFNFDNTSKQSISDSFKAFKSKYNAQTIMSVNVYNYGSKVMQHIKLTAK